MFLVTFLSWLHDCIVRLRPVSGYLNEINQKGTHGFK